jgi:hypothetical protein
MEEFVGLKSNMSCLKFLNPLSKNIRFRIASRLLVLLSLVVFWLAFGPLNLLAFLLDGSDAVEIVYRFSV